MSNANKKTRMVWILGIIGVVLFLVIALPRLGVEAGKEITLFSAVTGQLVNEAGEPQAGVTITRTWAWDQDEQKSGSDEVTTDDTGNFAFPAVVERSVSSSFLPVQNVIRQSMTIGSGDTLVELWKHAKLRNEANSELDGRQLNIVCYSDRKPSPDGPVYGTCVER